MAKDDESEAAGGGLVSGLIAVLFIGGIVWLAVSGTASHRDAVKRYVGALQADRFEEAHSLLVAERRPSLEGFGKGGEAALLRASSELVVNATEAGSAGRGCVRATVQVEDERVGFTFYTLEVGDAVRVHSVFRTADLNASRASGPWRCGNQ